VKRLVKWALLLILAGALSRAFLPVAYGHVNQVYPDQPEYPAEISERGLDRRPFAAPPPGGGISLR